MFARGFTSTRSLLSSHESEQQAETRKKNGEGECGVNRHIDRFAGFYPDNGKIVPPPKGPPPYTQSPSSQLHYPAKYNKADSMVRQREAGGGAGKVNEELGRDWPNTAVPE